jgi:hypothetical protein
MDRLQYGGHVPFVGAPLAVGIGTTAVELARVEDFANPKLRDDAEATPNMILRNSARYCYDPVGLSAT